MSRFATFLFAGLVSLFTIASGVARAATVDALIPAAAPHGARVLLTGRLLDDPSLAVAFTSATGTPVPAPVVARAESFLEVAVPFTASSGPVNVTAAGALVGSQTFTLAPDPSYVSVGTLIRASASHDLLKGPSGSVVLLANGNAYVADSKHNQIRVAGSDGTLGVVIGTGKPGRADGPLGSAEFRLPSGVALDEARRILYVADTGNHLIRSIASDGIVRTVAGTGAPGRADGVGQISSFNQPSGLAVDLDGTLYVADSGNDAIRKVAPDGTVTTIAGGQRPGFVDGPAATALFHAPRGIAMGPDGAIYIADSLNHAIRVLAQGLVQTLAGNGTPGYRDGNGRDAELHEPSGVAMDDQGRLLIADSQNNVIRAVTLDGIVTTVAGATSSGYADGAALLARFKQPSGIVCAGVLYVADTGNDAVRIISTAPSLAAVYKSRGPAAGGNEVRIFGTGFMPGATSVSFGGVPATDVTFVTSTELVVRVPAGEGHVDVRLTTPAGAATLENAYQYLLPPAIALIDPALGRTSGGDSVTITGSGFSSDMTVKFGGNDAAVQSQTETSAVVITPAGSPGPVDVVVTTEGGSTTSAGRFTYLAPPRIDSFSPDHGKPGTSVTILGANFESGGSTVRFNGTAAAIVSATPTQIIAIVPLGATTGPVSVATAGGSVTSNASFVIVTMDHIEVAPAILRIDAGSVRAFTATAVSPDGSRSDITNQATWLSTNPAVATVDAHGVVRFLVSGDILIQAAWSGFHARSPVHVDAAPILPPDPSLVAPPLDPTIVTPLFESVEFLYTGPNPIQTGVAPGVMVDERIATLRGRVITRDGFPLPGATIRVANHPEFGSTLSRADGVFDLVVNGGNRITLELSKNGYLVAQRSVPLLWGQREAIDDVALLPISDTVTTINSAAPSLQLARGPMVTDDSGSRQATLLFKAGTTASLISGAFTTPLSSIHVRATEYTVGGSGPAAMPAVLPATSGYTYCVELSADEASASQSVRFSAPVVVYVDNFLSFPTGMIVPSGYYDRTAGVWKSSDNGLVIRILSVGAGTVTLDTNGDGAADSDATLLGLSIDAAERQTLASLYLPGQTLWRVPVLHFTSYDFNEPMALGAPAGALSPAEALPRPTVASNVPCGTKARGSIIDCHNQTLGESIPITGTPYKLEYDSGRTARTAYTMTIPLTPATLPTSLRSVELTISVAGRTFTWTYAPAANLEEHFAWDGRDAFGREVTGAQTATVTVRYAYPAVYLRPARGPLAFPRPSDSGQMVAPGRAPISLDSTWYVTLGHIDALHLGLGGWTFTGQRLYDSTGFTIYEGGGTERSADPLRIGDAVLQRVAGTYEWGDQSDGRPARETTLDYPESVAPAADGSFYLSTGWKIQFVDRTGILTTIAGTGSPGFTPDGTQAKNHPIRGLDLAIGPDGLLYFNDMYNYRVRKLVAGAWVTVAGTGVAGYNGEGDNGLATAAKINPIGIGFGPDGSLYIAEWYRIRRVGPDGIISTIAGGGSNYANDVPATQTSIGGALGVAAGPDGSVYFSDGGTVHRITPDGFIHLTAGGGGSTWEEVEDGAPATSGVMGYDWGISVAADGTLLIAERNPSIWSRNAPYKVRAVKSDGTITTLAGTNDDSSTPSPDGSLACATNLSYPYDVKFGPDGRAWIVNTNMNVIQRTESLFPAARPATATLIPSADGAVVYRFEEGRQTATVDALRGVTLETLTYNTAGLLTGINDRDGRITTIERDGAGNVTAVVAPGGQRTAIVTDGEHITSITNPASESYAFTYGSDGLLATLEDPRHGLHIFTYDSNGKLTRDEDPAGGFTELAKTGDGDHFSILRTTGEGRQMTLGFDLLPSLATRRNVVGFDGLTTQVQVNPDGSTTSTAPDGTVTSAGKIPDPRFAMAAPTDSYTLTTPSGLSFTRGTSRTATLTDPSNPLSLTSLTETLLVNGRQWRSDWTPATSTLVSTSPEGRIVTSTLDAKGRVVSTAAPSQLLVNYQYDSLGRIIAITQGTRVTSFGWNAKDELEWITDPMLRTTRFSYDPAGRVTQQTLPDQHVIGFGYDANGNVTSVTPPGRPAHGFGFTPVDLTGSYSPPQSDPGGSTTYGYDTDRNLTLISRPDGKTISLQYGKTTGRLESMATSRGETQFVYDPGTGNLTSITAPDGTQLTYAYDGGVTKQETSTGTGSVSWTYNNDLQVSGETVNGAGTVGWGRDHDGLLTSAGDLAIARDSANGRIKGTTLGTITDAWTYNDHSEPSIYSAAVQGSEVFRQEYGRDDDGRITGIKETRYGVTTTTGYSYDPAGHLQDVTRNGALQATYAYGANGNRDSVIRGGVQKSATYDAQDRLLTYGDATYTYTANGELATNTDVAGVTHYEYDELGNPVHVDLPDGTVIEYLIDARNRRVGKKVNGSIVARWIYSGQLQIAAELDANGAVVARFVYASRANVPDYIIRGQSISRVIADQVGSVRYVIDATTGAVIQAIDYDEFGNVLNDSNPAFQPFGFAGGLYDRDTGLTRFGARDYAAFAGRWTNKDPIGFDGSQSNLYTYTFADPVNWIDPTGTDVWLEGPSDDEPPGHLSLAVGDPLGEYKAYSFASLALDGIFHNSRVGWLPGEVYEDAFPGGAIDASHYLKTTAAEDAQILDLLRSKEFTQGTYFPGYQTCRSWSVDNFNKIAKRYGKRGKAPKRPLAPWKWRP